MCIRDSPSVLYVGDTTTVKTILTNTDSVEWSLTLNGTAKELTGFTKDGGELSFLESGTYVLKGVAKNGSNTDTCEQTVKVIPVANLGFSLPQYAHTDSTTPVKLLFENGEGGNVSWSIS